MISIIDKEVKESIVKYVAEDSRISKIINSGDKDAKDLNRI